MRFNRRYRFIKVTPKGFNLLDLESNRCFFKQHLYSREWNHKEIPEPIHRVKNVPVHNAFQFIEVKQLTT
jgi:hypothetical protein